MGADASIYSMIRPQERESGPLDQYASMMQLRAMGDASQLHAMQRRKLQSDFDEEGAFKSKIADWVAAGGKGDLSPEAWAASPARAQAFSKSQLDSQKSAAELEKTKIEMHGKQMGQLRDRLSAVQGDQDLPPLRDFMAKVYGPKAAESMPQSVSDPAWADWQRKGLMTADKFIEQSTPKFEKVDIGGKIQMVDTNPFTNPAIKGMNLQKTQTPDSIASNATTRRGQDQPVWDEQRGVFVPRPWVPGGGGVSAAPGGAPAAPGAPAATPAVIKPTGLPARAGDVSALRKEFNDLPEVKEFKATLPIVEAARAAADTRAGDIQLFYAVGKILDPNSVVRDGELKISAEAATTLSKYMNEAKSAVMGTGRLSSDTRKDLLGMLDNAVTQREGAYKQAETTYRGIADKNGIAHDQVIITPMARTKAAPEAPAAKSFDSMPDPAKFSGRRIKAPDGTVYQSDGKAWKRG